MNVELAVQIAEEMGIKWECVVLHPYLDSVGIPTIGVGATYYEDGTKVAITDAPITLERAKALHTWMIRIIYLPAVLKLCPNIDNPNRLAAIIDFTYNCGKSSLKVSTLRKRINSGRWDDVPNQLLKWNKAGGRVFSGLTKRRKAEGAMCVSHPSAQA